MHDVIYCIHGKSDLPDLPVMGIKYTHHYFSTNSLTFDCDAQPLVVFALSVQTHLRKRETCFLEWIQFSRVNTLALHIKMKLKWS